MSTQPMSTIQIINGQPLLQAKVQHILTPGGPMAVAVVPSSLGAILGPLLQQIPGSSPKNGTLIFNLPGTSTSPSKLEPTTSAKGGRRSRPSKQRNSVVANENKRLLSKDPCLEINSAKSYAPIKPKIVDNSSLLTSSFDTRQPVILSAQVPLPSQMTIHLNESEQNEIASVSEQINKLVSAMSGSSSDEAAVQQLEHRRRSILEHAAYEQLRLVNQSNPLSIPLPLRVIPPSASPSQQQDSPVILQLPVGTSRTNSVISQVPVSVISNHVGIPESSSGQQLVQINGTTYLVVQPKSQNLPEPSPPPKLLIQSSYPVTEQQHAKTKNVFAEPKRIQPEQKQALNSDSNNSFDSPASSKDASLNSQAEPAKSSRQLLVDFEHLMDKHVRCVLQPDYNNPFKDCADVVERLVPYHCCWESDVHPEILDSTDSLYETKMASLMQCKQRLVNRVRLLMLETSAKLAPPEEMVLLDKLFLNTESAFLDRRHENENAEHTDVVSESELSSKERASTVSTPSSLNPSPKSEESVVDEQTAAVQSLRCDRSPGSLSAYLKALHESLPPVNYQRLSQKSLVSSEESFHHQRELRSEGGQVDAVHSRSEASSPAMVVTSPKRSEHKNGLKIIIKLNAEQRHIVREPNGCLSSSSSDSVVTSRPCSPQRVPPLRLRLSNLSFNVNGGKQPPNHAQESDSDGSDGYMADSTEAEESETESEEDDWINGVCYPRLRCQINQMDVKGDPYAAGKLKLRLISSPSRRRKQCCDNQTPKQNFNNGYECSPAVKKRLKSIGDHHLR
ncbi:GLTSCR1 domain containing protein [Trichuris trichiura]|uniref:GLTSCR1 domain containing protein n=1 Tax=Trichuris trichiura TaxID=36087 RepID=A0A077YYX3_TRITR|nr:GLTSCR1 domain containing protein [Trichuris trichiura]